MPLCYLTFEEKNSGTLFLNWKEKSDESINSIMEFETKKTVPKFKFTSHGGISELKRNCGGGVKINDFYIGVADFVKLAHSFQASDIKMRKSNWPNPVAIFLLGKDAKVNKVTEETAVKNIDAMQAIAVVHQDSTNFECSTMESSIFLNNARSRGASLAF